MFIIYVKKNFFPLSMTAPGYAAPYSPLGRKADPSFNSHGNGSPRSWRNQGPSRPRKMKNRDILMEDLERFVEVVGEPVIAIGHFLGRAVSLLLTVKRPDWCGPFSCLIRPSCLIPGPGAGFCLKKWGCLRTKLGIPHQNISTSTLHFILRRFEGKRH